jgi:anti-sigma factor RsiW
MTTSACAAALGDDALIAYWLGELGQAEEARIDEHVLGCANCSERLAGIVRLADGIRAAVRAGMARMFVTDAFVRSAVEHGTRVREYRVARNGSVNCSVAPEDELLVSRLEAPLAGVRRVDVISYLNDAQTDVFRDVPFDARSGEVVVAPQLAQLRAMPSHRRRLRLLAVDDSGERVLGDYTFNHTPHGAS